MCGRYALALRPSQVRRMLEEDGMHVDDAPSDEGEETPPQTYNFAPGYNGLVYRADTPGPRVAPQDDRPGLNHFDEAPPTFKLQSMKWGLVSSWMNRLAENKSHPKAINCRADSLVMSGGMWAQVKGTRRCVIIAQGFFEWLKTGPKEKLPYFTKRNDGHLMCFAGLWDCIEKEGSPEKLYSYSIITTDSNNQLKFLHDRMPVILEPGSSELKAWLDPERQEWSAELQSILRPFDGQLSVYPVNKDVGKVGNNSPSFVIPLDSKDNKYNIANMFAAAPQGKAIALPKPTKGCTSARQVFKTATEEDDTSSQEHTAEQLPSQKRNANMMSGKEKELLSNKRRHVDEDTKKPPPSQPRKITSFFEKRDH